VSEQLRSPVVQAEVRRGVYYDSVVLMQLQRTLAGMPGVHDAGVVMGTSANKELLLQSGLLNSEAEGASVDDLVLVVRAENEHAAIQALAQVDPLLARRAGQSEIDDYRPKRLASALQLAPAAQWVLISTPGRYAAEVAREALAAGRNVFLYSDNVALEDECELKAMASASGLLLMGPDCGTAIINGAGLGFANQVQRGSIGVIGASGTGIQLVTSRIHQLGGGISHAIGTGGRDLSEAVAASTTLQALKLLGRDRATRVIVLISKPPAPAVAQRVLAEAATTGKTIIVNFIGYFPEQNGRKAHSNVRFAATLDEAAMIAVEFEKSPEATVTPAVDLDGFLASQRYVRGLYSGGTLAYEALLLLQNYLPVLNSNVPLAGQPALAKATESTQHTVVDLGDDEFTVGRLHPMLDNEMRVKRLLQEAADPQAAVILLDVVLGHGAHPDPASELAPAIGQAKAMASGQNRRLDVIVALIGTDADPQGLDEQRAQLEEAGALVEQSHSAAVHLAGALVAALENRETVGTADGALNAPVAAINVGLELFADSLKAQGTTVVQMDWRPPAGGNQRLMGILARMRPRSQS
jgi:FdrA protein